MIWRERDGSSNWKFTPLDNAVLKNVILLVGEGDFHSCALLAPMLPVLYFHYLEPLTWEKGKKKGSNAWCSNAQCCQWCKQREFVEGDFLLLFKIIMKCFQMHEEAPPNPLYLQQLFLCLQPKLLSINCVWNFILMGVEWERNSGSHFHFVQTGVKMYRWI